nr:polycystic kidney disease protein 1-like 2 [Crassostrea gigas]
MDKLALVAKAIHRVLDNLLNKMLPEKLQDLDKELSEEEIRSTIYRQTTRFLHESFLLKKYEGNITLDHKLINLRASLVFQIRKHEQSKQKLQRKLAKKNIPTIMKVLSVFIKVMEKTVALGDRLFLNGLHVLEIMIRKVSTNHLSNTEDPFFTSLYMKDDTENRCSYLTISIANFMKNPYIYGENSSIATSSVIKIEQNIIINSSVPNIGIATYKNYTPLMNPAYPEKMIYFTYDVTYDGDASIIYMKPDGFHESFKKNKTFYSFFFSSKTFPTTSNFEYRKVLGIRDWTKYGFKVFLPGGICGKGACFLGIKPQTVESSKSRIKRTVSNVAVEEPFRNVTSLEQISLESLNLSIIFTTTGCRKWNEDTKGWTMEDCTVLPMSDLNNTVCRCTGNTFSSSFYIPPNVINFLTVWGKFDASNASVYGTLIGVFVIYVVAIIFLRREDKKDVQKWKVTFLSDHRPAHVYFYLISVHTGLRRDAGTKSNVQFIVTGELCDSGIRVLDDEKTKGFSASSVKKLFFGTTEPLGDLLYLRIWHDNSGPPGYQSWFLDKVIIDDLQSRDRYFFYCNKWLAIDDGDCKLDRIIPASAPNLISPKTRLTDETQTQITEHHLWLSLLLRPRQSKFTRVQRISCLLALLCLIMISNAMFFRSSSENQNVDQVKFGVLRISSLTLYVSCIGILISTLPVVFASYVFRHINNGLKTKQNSSESKNIDRPYKSNDNLVSLSDVDTDVFQQEDDKFPHWIYYVAWVILAMSVISSCFFLILYSMEWGDTKSEEWLSSFVFSLVESLTVVDPMKVLIIAITSSILFTNWMQENAPKINLWKLRKISLISRRFQDTNISEIAKYVLPTYDLVSEEERMDLRKKCQEKSKATSALRNLVFFIVYIIAIYLISYKERDQRAFHLKQNLDNHLFLGKDGFSTITDKKGFYTWLNETFIPTYYPVNNYASKPLTVVDRQWFQDMASIRVGPARLRQVRMKSGSCKYSKLVGTYPCIETYSERNEDQSLYCLEWKSFNDSSCGTNDYKNRFYTADSWKYTKASDIWGISRMGEYNTYSGGGYILKFVKDRENAYLLLKELVEHDWINRNTRAVFLEFTMYNPNVNLFVYAMLLTEFPEVGSALTWVDSRTFKPVLNFSSLGFDLVLAYFIFVFYYIFLLFKILRNCSQFGCKTFLKDPWNVVDCISTFLACSCFVTIVVKLDYTSKAVDMFYEDKMTAANRFINYGHIVIWDNAFNFFFAALVFVSTIQILKILGYNKRFTEILSVIAYARRDLLSFGLNLSILIIAFIFFAYLLFGSKNENYRSLFITCGSLANTFIGKNKFDSLVIASPLTAQFFLMTYVFFVIMFMLTIFLSILNNSISAVRAETAGASNSLGMMHIVKNSFRNFVEFFFKPKKREKLEKYVLFKAKDEVNAGNTLVLLKDIIAVHFKVTKESNSREEE